MPDPEDKDDTLHGWAEICSYVNKCRDSTVPSTTIRSWERRYGLPVMRNGSGNVYSRKPYIARWCSMMSTGESSRKWKQRCIRLESRLMVISDVASVHGMDKLADAVLKEAKKAAGDL